MYNSDFDLNVVMVVEIALQFNTCVALKRHGGETLIAVGKKTNRDVFCKLGQELIDTCRVDGLREDFILDLSAERMNLYLGVDDYMAS